MRMWTHTQLLVDISVAQDWCVDDQFSTTVPGYFAASRQWLLQVVGTCGSLSRRSHLEFPVPPGNEEFAERRRLMATERVSLCLSFFFGWEVMASSHRLLLSIPPFLHASSSLGHSRFSVPFYGRHKMAHAARKNTCNTKKIPKVRVLCVSGREWQTHVD